MEEFTVTDAADALNDCAARAEAASFLLGELIDPHATPERQNSIEYAITDVLDALRSGARLAAERCCS